jgi:hypothetical protein
MGSHFADIERLWRGNGGEANGVSLHFSISRLDWIVLADPRRFEDLWLEEPFE